MGLQVPFAPYLLVFFFHYCKYLFRETQTQGAGYFRTFWVGIDRCAAGTMEPLAYTRASSSKFCYPLLD